MRNRALAALLTAIPAFAQYKAVNPQVSKIVSEVSEERITANLKKLESFGTRYIYSSQDDPEHGVGAARTWIYDQFRSYSPRLEVSFDQYRVKGETTRGTRIPKVDLYNVVAVLPGTTNKDHRVLITAHYDTVNMTRPPGSPPPQPGDGPVGSAKDPNISAPGVTDDGSGIACVMELARVMSQYQFEKTLVFVAFTAEEEGLLGATLYAEKARKLDQKIEAVLNNDIIGTDVGGDGAMENRRVSIFSEDPIDSPSREIARYAREIGERYVPEMDVDLVFRADRFGRGGDHTAFNLENFPAVRLSTPVENYANQHSATDSFAGTSPGYITHVTKVNGAVAASLAWAPKSPLTTEMVDRNGRKVPNLLLTRGKSRYDAALKWKQENPEPDLAGYVILMRRTTAPFWEREIYVGNVSEYTMPDVSIDDLVFGVKAIDKEGNESLTTPYVQPPRVKRKLEVIETSASGK
jgi:hypothetical protein